MQLSYRWNADSSVLLLFTFIAQDSGSSPWVWAGPGGLRSFPRRCCDQRKRSICVGERRQWYEKWAFIVLTARSSLRWWFVPRAPEHSRIVGSLSRRSPGAGHPRHPQLSPAGVFACGIWGAEGGVWGGLLHDYQQPGQHNGMWKQQVIILPLNPKQWLCELMRRQKQSFF